MAKLFLLFLLVPLTEIYLLIEVGSMLGAVPTIAIVVSTALIGAALVRFQGFSTLARAQGEILQKRVPTMAVMEGGILLLAGVMLFIPGFFTDAIGFLLLVPPLRQYLLGQFLTRRVMPFNDHIEGEVSDRDPFDDHPRIIDIERKDTD